MQEGEIPAQLLVMQLHEILLLFSGPLENASSEQNPALSSKLLPNCKHGDHSCKQREKKICKFKQIHSSFSSEKKLSCYLKQPDCQSNVLTYKWKSFLIFTLLISALSLISAFKLIDNNIRFLPWLTQHLCIFTQVSRVEIVHISLIHLPMLVKSPDKISST